MRDFDEWLSKFRPSISSYDYYIDFEKVVRNVEEIKVELNILNSLIGSKTIEKDFEKIVLKYPETLQCVPLLLAVRGYEIYAQDEDGAFLYNFKKMNYLFLLKHISKELSVYISYWLYYSICRTYNTFVW